METGDYEAHWARAHVTAAQGVSGCLAQEQSIAPPRFKVRRRL